MIICSLTVTHNKIKYNFMTNTIINICNKLRPSTIYASYNRTRNKNHLPELKTKNQNPPR